MRRTGLDVALVDQLFERAQSRCEACGHGLLRSGRGRYWSVQHRRAHGMGGTRWPGIDLSSNLLILCGHATTPGGCHYFCEQRNGYAEECGWVVPRHLDPVTVSVLVAGVGRRYLTNEATYSTEPPGEVA